jgi:hypothetical protein
MTVDRRRSPRQALGRDVFVCSEDGKPIGVCHLLDVSASGARLSMAPRQLAKLPEDFILVLAKGGKVYRRCRIVWRGEEEVGVRFRAAVRSRSSASANSAASAGRSPATAV